MLTRIFSLCLLGMTASASASDFAPITKLPAAVASDTPEKEAELSALGRLLFFDARLSGDGSTACADCHDADLGFGDGSELGRGYPGTKHWRNAQTVVNAAFLKNGLHWDGSVQSLLHQVPGAMGTSFSSNIDPVIAEERLRQVPHYAERFDAIWGAGPDLEKISQAIAAYERSLISADSPFDLFAGGDLSALSAEAQSGMKIFSGKGNCVACHNGMLATDQDFHNTTVPRNPDFTDDPLRQVTFRAAMRGFGVERDVYEMLERDPGRYAATKDPDDLGKFRTPPLRYLKYTAPYMHNGMFYTLEEVVDFYDAGGTEDVFGTKSPEIRPLGLTDTEKSQLVAFLESLSGTEITETYPELPDYTATSKPEAGIVTTAVLRSRGGVSTNSTQTALQSGLSSSSSGLVIQQTGTTAAPQTSGLEAESGGLTIVPSGTGQGAAALTNTATATNDGKQPTVIVVAPGETLGSIARRELGDVLKYQAIYEANRDRISDPNNLVPGTMLVLPEV